MRNFGNPDKKGTLTKQGKRVASWKSRTVILKDKYLYYFKSTSGGSEPAGTIPLMHSEIKITEVEVKKKHCFQVGARTCVCVCVCVCVLLLVLVVCFFQYVTFAHTSSLHSLAFARLSCRFRIRACRSGGPGLWRPSRSRRWWSG